MANAITKQQFDQIHKLINDNPSISSREIGRRIGLGHDAVSKWRHRTTHPDGKASMDATFSIPTHQGEVITPVEEHKLRSENKSLRKQINDLLSVQAVDDKIADFSNKLAAQRIDIPKWVGKRVTKGTDPAIAAALASDWHLDEVVYREQINGCNQYNRAIADVRCGQFFDSTVKLAKKYIGGIRFEGLFLFLGGDMFSGNIHEELKETNECTIIESLLYWTPKLVSGIQYLADNFEHVHIPCVVGNHGRNTRKPQAKNRAQDNFDWLFYHMIAMQLKNDTRITWDISPSADCLVSIYETDILFTHGDQFRGGTGIAGLLSPLLLGDARKRKRQAAIGQPYEWMAYGHWHSLVPGIRGLLGNGSLKGYDEYAMVSNFDFEPPQQLLWLVDPKKGITGRWPIHVLGDDEDYSR